MGLGTATNHRCFDDEWKVTRDTCKTTISAYPITSVQYGSTMDGGSLDAKVFLVQWSINCKHYIPERWLLTKNACAAEGEGC